MGKHFDIGLTKSNNTNTIASIASDYYAIAYVDGSTTTIFQTGQGIQLT